MPKLPATGGKVTGQETLTLLAAGGDINTVAIEYNPEATTAQVDELWLRVGNVTNAAAFKRSSTQATEWSKGVVNPYDESYSNGSVKMILVFQDEDLNEKRIAIPAPDEQYFGSDGITVVSTNVNVSALTTAINAYLNEGATPGTYTFLRGFRSDQSRRLPKPRTVRDPVEPGVGDLPSDAPGT